MHGLRKGRLKRLTGDAVNLLCLLTVFLFRIGGMEAAATSELRGMSIDDLLRLEGIGTVAFSPDGKRVVFERLRPYEESPDFGRHLLARRDRAHLYVATLRESAPEVRPLFDQDSKRGYWLGPFSPNGRRLAVFWIDHGGVNAGVYDFESEQLTKFAVRPEILYYGRSPLWISDTELVYVALSQGRQPLWAMTPRTGAQSLPELWNRASRGKQATATVLGSGDYRAAGAATSAGSLVKVEAVTGTVTNLDDGIFSQPVLSPDRRYLAVVRHRAPATGNGASRLLQPHPTLAGLDAELVLYPLAGIAGEAMRCSACQPVPGSLAWAPDGRRLLFLDAGSHPKAAKLMTFNLADGAASHVTQAALEVAGEPRRALTETYSLWLGDQIALHATPSQEADRRSPASGNEPRDEVTRADWYLLDGDGAAVNMTKAFSSVPARPLAVGANAIFLLLAGDVWQVSVKGRRHNLTTHIASPLVAWRPPAWAEGLGRPPERHSVVLETTQDSGEREVFILDLETSRLDRVARLSKDSEALAVSATSRMAVVRRDREDGGRLELVTADGPDRELATFNQHLVHVSPGQPVPIHYPGPGGRELAAWLLLPPKPESGARPPLVVNVYPGAMQDGAWPWRLSATSPFNPHLLAGQGYAVLFPSIPLGPEGKAGNPLAGLADIVLRAVDRVIELGYTDSWRLALFGQSYGGYGVLGILGQTDRFRAAVVSAAPTNLISAYGQFDPRFLFAESPLLFLAQPRWAEVGQGRMGGPPWRDLERYVRNSPLFLAESIETPLMMVHGDRDFVSVTQAEEMFTALYRLNKDAVLIRYWGEGHILASPANIRDFWRRVFAWYGRHLGADTSERPDDSEPCAILPNSQENPRPC